MGFWRDLRSVMRGKRCELRLEFTQGNAQGFGWKEVMKYPYEYNNALNHLGQASLRAGSE